VQDFYTEERLLHITTDTLRRTTEAFTVNQVSSEGKILNDLTLGEYNIVVTNQPERDTLEDSTFEQAAEMRKELGVAIPDEVLIKNSRLPNKFEVLQAIENANNSEAAQQQQEIDQARQMAEIGQMEAGTRRDDADTMVKQVKARTDALAMQRPIDPEAQLRVEADIATSKYQTDVDAMLKREQMQVDLTIAREQIAADKETAALAAKAAAATAKATANKAKAKPKPTAK
jgi:membrane protein involved in colicin uptake